MQCSECGTKQHEGKFCGDCGGQLIEATDGEGHSQEQIAASEEPATATTASTSTNESMEKVMEMSRAFGAYFTHYLKQPSRIFSKGSDEFKNGLISMIVVAVLFALAFYNLIKFDFYGMGPSFLSVVGNALFGIAVFIAVIISLLFLINKFFGGKNLTFADIASIYGVHLLPVVILVGATLLLALANSLTLASVLLSISMIFITIILPLYLISSLLTQHPKGVDPLYGYVFYIVAAVISFLIIFAIFVDSLVNQFMGRFF